MESVDEDRLFISVVSLAELHYGVERLPAGRRRDRLGQWIQQELPLRFEDRILTVDTNVAEAWGKTVSRGEAAGRPIGAMDAFVAATAENHLLTLLNPKVSDFSMLCPNFKPWT